jgi:tetratricopeptide (TPR) repeat protein
MTKTILCAALILCPLPGAQQPAMSPAEISIQKALADIAQQPTHYPYYNALAMAYARRARETSDVSYYGKAEETLKKSFALSPGNYEGLKVQTWLLLGRHEFTSALNAATQLNRKQPDDITVYGYLVDANAELGNYSDAVSAAQWMLNLRPGNVAGLTRAAYLRELHGDLAGALELMQMAYDATPYQQFEDRAWLLTQIAHLHLVEGSLSKAETYAKGALGVFKDYHYALGVLGQVRMAQRRYREAEELFRARYAQAPHAENLYAAGEALYKEGRRDEANAVFAEFERKALQESGIADNANHELIAYYTDYAGRPAEALRLARQELTRRHDVFTIDAYAWSLAKCGNYAEAARQIRKAVAIGLKDPKVQQHAKSIEARLSAEGVKRASR